MITVCRKCGKEFNLGSNVIEFVFKCGACGTVNKFVKGGGPASAPSQATGQARAQKAASSRKKEGRFFSKPKILITAGVLLLLVCFGAYYTYVGIWPWTKKPIILGCPLATDFADGRAAARGIRLAVDEINAGGGVKVNGKKRPFDVVVMNTRDLAPGVSVTESIEIVKKLIVERKADFILGGPVRSEAALAAMDILSEHNKISILTTGVLTPKYHALIEEKYDNYKNCFRITGEAKWMVNEIITCLDYIKETYGFNKIQLILQDVSHSLAGGDIIGKLASQRGWTVTGRAVYPTGANDFSRALRKAAESSAQVLLIWMDMPESAILLKQWHDMKIPALPFGAIIPTVAEPGFWDKVEGKGEYCLDSVVNAGNAPSDATQWTMKFYKAYTQKWGVEPEGYGASSSFMATYVLKDAIERADSLDSNKVIAALESTDIIGVYGRIRFGHKNHQVIPSFDPKEGAVGTIFQWQGGKRVVVFPVNIAKGKIKLPPWMKTGNIDQ